MISWSDDERKALSAAWMSGWEGGTLIDKVATRAVELVAARGGTMTAERLAEVDEYLRSWSTHDDHAKKAVEALDHLAAQGARVAVLETENAKCLRLASDACAKSERLEKATQSEAVWRKRLEAAAEELADVAPGECGRLDIVARVKRLKARCATLAHPPIFDPPAGARLSTLRPLILQLADLSVDMAKVVGEQIRPVMEPSDIAPGSTFDERGRTRYPCSPTCTHDDAATPGHAERVKGMSRHLTAFAFREARLSPDGEAARRPDGDNDAALTEEYAKGAEAMRAACLEAAMEVWESSKGVVSRNDLKAAIEGAAP